MLEKNQPTAIVAKKVTLDGRGDGYPEITESVIDSEDDQKVVILNPPEETIIFDFERSSVVRVGSVVDYENKISGRAEVRNDSIKSNRNWLLVLTIIMSISFSVGNISADFFRLL